MKFNREQALLWFLRTLILSGLGLTIFTSLTPTTNYEPANEIRPTIVSVSMDLQTKSLSVKQLHPTKIGTSLHYIGLLQNDSLEFRHPLVQLQLLSTNGQLIGKGIADNLEQVVMLPNSWLGFDLVTDQPYTTGLTAVLTITGQLSQVKAVGGILVAHKSEVSSNSTLISGVLRGEESGGQMLIITGYDQNHQVIAVRNSYSQEAKVGTSLFELSIPYKLFDYAIYLVPK